MRKRKRLTGEARREQILEAALQLFAERGFAGTSTRELAAHVGVTEPVLYRHFRSKEDLLREVARRNSFLPHLKQFAELDMGMPLRDHLLTLARRWRQFVRERRHLVLLVLREMHHTPEIARVFRETLQEGLALAAQGIRAHADLTGFDAQRVDAVVRLFFSSLVGHLVMEGPDYVAEDPRMEAFLEQTVDVLLDGMRQD